MTQFRRAAARVLPGLALSLAVSLAHAGAESLGASNPVADPIDAFVTVPSHAANAPAPRWPLPRPGARVTSAWIRDWSVIIDSTWGASPLTTTQQLAMFDKFYSTADRYYACFQGLTVDWTGLYNSYRPQIAAGVSRGRFAAIMDHFARALRESHTRAEDLGVVYSQTNPGVPLMIFGGWGPNRHFGAGLTPMPDSSLLVYNVVPNHPLGLQPGDRVLGYDGVRWADLYPQLLAAEMPMSGGYWGSAPSSYHHSFMIAAGLNWHLFDTIDIVRYATGDVVHLSVGPLASQTTLIDCTEQLPVPGVRLPDWTAEADTVSWGVVTGTSVGYIYVRAWVGGAGNRFLTAIDSLTRVQGVSGLVIDFRVNYGGNMFLAYPGLQRLYDHDVATIGWARRSSSDHLAMTTAGEPSPLAYWIHGSPVNYFGGPVAVLVGPGAVSSGDQIANLFKFRPNTRFFGKSTAAAFNAPAVVDLGQPGWYSRMAEDDAFNVGQPAPTNYLSHDEFTVDEPVWLTPDDVARHVDTVAFAALRWLGAPAGVLWGEAAQCTVAPNPFLARTTLRFTLVAEGPARLAVYDVTGRRVSVLFDARAVAPGWQECAWDTRDAAGRTLAPGVYLARLETATGTIVRRIVHLR